MNDFYALIALAFEKRAIRKLVFSRPVSKELPEKITARPAIRRTHAVLAMEKTLKGDTVSQQNVPESELEQVVLPLLSEYRQINLLTPEGDAELKQNKDGRAVQLGADKLLRRLTSASVTPEEAIASLDRKKNYILEGNEPFLRVLGISDTTGRVHDKRQAKFRQINRFLEILADHYGNLPKDGELFVLDLCSGKSYLSFAVYHYLTALRGRQVRMLAVDLKEDVIRYCADAAAKMGYDGMEFRVEDVTRTVCERAPDLVISLHACDVATDIVLENAVRHGARMILSTPCCHRELSRHINCEELAFVTRYGKLRDKLCEALTDGLRLLYLESEGYRTAALELTDPDDTPKNTLLVAIKNGRKDNNRQAAYEHALVYLLGDQKDQYKR